jgi:hypothetical protein
MSSGIANPEVWVSKQRYLRKRRGENSAPSGKGLAPRGASRQRLSYPHREQLNIGHRADILYYFVSILPSFLHLLEKRKRSSVGFLVFLEQPEFESKECCLHTIRDLELAHDVL